MKLNFYDICARCIKSTFSFRFVFASFCRKVPPLTWIVDKMFFDGDDIQVLSRDNAIQLSHQGNIKELDVNVGVPIPNKNTVLSSKVLWEMIKTSRYFF